MLPLVKVYCDSRTREEKESIGNSSVLPTQRAVICHFLVGMSLRSKASYDLNWKRSMSYEIDGKVGCGKEGAHSVAASPIWGLYPRDCSTPCYDGAFHG